LKQRLDEVSALAEERQTGLEKLQQELSRAGLMADKFDFSKLTSREKNATITENDKVGNSKPDIKVETDNASKTDTLLSEIFNSGTGNLRSYASATNHSLLGSHTGSVDLAAAIRAA
jgi:hypothetical protein